MKERVLPTMIEGTSRAAHWERRARVAAIIVTYNPRTDSVARNVALVRAQVDHVIIVDNGSRQDILVSLNALADAGNCSLIALGKNSGIGAAQNQGIGYARQLLISSGADLPEFRYFLLLDHDSEPSCDMVTRLIRADQALRSQGVDVGAVGPVIVDSRTTTRGRFVRHGRMGISRIPCRTEGTMAVDFLIASGTVIRDDVIDRVGALNEALFIDHVDTEWCLRATACGLKLFAVCDATLEHSLGDDVIRLWFGRWREVFVHSPLRDYYMCRNTVLLLQGTPMTWAWRMFLIGRMVASVVFFCALVPPRRTRAIFVARAIADGISQRVGAVVLR
ncbi:glycosyltransferase family 2 protein [Mycetohabitans endofungorum]|uniref:glycosyltransferase family 2 protein n=1 Tax=Mycetohabitans endofungorum TaxID=417203 RepID=UPI0030CAA24E